MRSPSEWPLAPTVRRVEHADHVDLIRRGVAGLENGKWAELGAGRGAFTLALADLLDTGGSIVAVDRDGGSLAQAADAVRRRFPVVTLEAIPIDFTSPLPLRDLDGILIANALHFVADPGPLIARIRMEYVCPGGHLVLVEYDAQVGNPWVPYPLAFAAWRELANRAGFTSTVEIGRRPSRFLGAIYSALSVS